MCRNFQPRIERGNMKTDNEIKFSFQSHDCELRNSNFIFTAKTSIYVLYKVYVGSLARIFSIRKIRTRHFQLENFFLFSIMSLRCANFINIPALVNGGCHV